MKQITVFVLLIILKLSFSQLQEFNLNQNITTANYSLCFERVYMIYYYNSSLYYTLGTENQKQQYTFYDSVRNRTVTSSQQIYPLFYNDYGVQGYQSYAIYSQDTERDLLKNITIINLRNSSLRQDYIFQSLQCLNMNQNNQKGNEILHICTFYDKYDQYIFYIQKDDETITILYQIMNSQNPSYYIIETKQNCNIFYQSFYACDDNCIYQIKFVDKKLQRVKYYCIELEEDIIESIQYQQQNYMLLFGQQKVYTFYNGYLIQMSPKVQYLLIKDFYSEEILINLNEISSSSIVLNNTFNFGVQLKSNDYLIGLSEQQNNQKVKYLYRIKNTQTKSDIQSYLISNQTSQSVYTFYQNSTDSDGNDFYVYNFDYNSGSIGLSYFKIEGNYTQFLEQQQNKLDSPFFWNCITFLVFSLSYIFLTYRRKSKMQNVKQQIQALVFQSKKELNKKEFFLKYDLKLNEPLGSGGFGDVFVADNKHKKLVKNKQIIKLMHDQYACKRIIYNRDISAEEQMNTVKNELEILFKLDKYEYVVKVQNYLLDQDQAIIALELAETNLQKIIQKKEENYLTDKFQEKDIVQFLDQIANTIADIYLEEKIAHRDLKPENILCKNGNYYLSDFGISQQVGKVSTKENIVFGTIKWMSPELKSLKIKDESLILQQIDLFKSDIFSLGLILLYMLTLIDISQVNQNESLKRSKLRGLTINRKADINILIIQLVSKMLETDPDKRPDASILKKCIEDIKTMDQKQSTDSQNFQEN